MNPLPAKAIATLASYEAQEISAEIALMQLLLAAGNLTILDEWLTAGGNTARRLATVAERHRQALRRTAALVAAGLTEAAGPDRLAAIRAQFDRAAALAPEAAVALYSLGDPAILDRATTEIVSLLDKWNLLANDRDALDVGCGIGRMALALAPRLRRMFGIDVSQAMVNEAERRCVGLANVSFSLTSGRDLAGFESESFDLILAVDSFPYIVAAGCGLAREHLRDAARLLRSGGALAIFNYSYRGDLDRDRADLAVSTAGSGLAVERNGTRDLNLWDGVSFLFRKQAFHRE
jgi:SAM-dependent methyltransferase